MKYVVVLKGLRNDWNACQRERARERGNCVELFGLEEREEQQDGLSMQRPVCSGEFFFC
jgi:hypothetical protein